MRRVEIYISKMASAPMGKEKYFLNCADKMDIEKMLEPINIRVVWTDED